MALCKDPRLTYLNSLGYNVLKLPRQKLPLISVIGQHKGAIQELGEISSIWKSTTPPPDEEQQQAGADINGQKTDNLKLSIGLDILNGVLKAMGSAVPQVNFAYQQARFVQFKFTNVRVNRVQPFKVGEYLSSGDLNEQNPFASYFFDEDKKAFVITDVLYSNSIKVVAKNNKGQEIGVDVPAIGNAVKAKVKVTLEQGTETIVTYEGASPLAFGFKVFGIAYVDGNWTIYGAKPGEEFAFDLTKEFEPILFTTSGTVDLPQRAQNV